MNPVRSVLRQDDMIVLKPTGGLCNRLRTIDSGILLSQKIHKPLQILWTLSANLNCSYYALFEPSNDFSVIDVQAVRCPSSGPMRRLYFLYDYAAARMKYQHVIFQSRMSRLREQGYDFAELARYKSVYITCCDRFYRIERRYRPLQPLPSIQSRVDDCVRKYSSHTVGVHVRRTDHHTVSPYASTQGYIDAMNLQIEQNPDTTFYLATDSSEIMSLLTGVFKDRIIWRPKEYVRDSEKGIQDALVDLLCLSMTKMIIGSRYSSFSETAAQLNDIPAIYITPD